MPRSIKPTSVHHTVLRNNFCALTNHRQLAAVSCHLRNYGLAQMIGIVGLLDSHPDLNRKPIVRRTPAQFQNAQGDSTNHFCHVLPSGLLLNGKNLDSYFKNEKSTKLIKDIFGRGVMAPDIWQQGDAFPINPAQQNIVDNIAEKYAGEGGLVSAFENTMRYAIEMSSFNGSGNPQHRGVQSLIEFVREAYETIWKPQASEAFDLAHTHLLGKRSAALAEGNAERVIKLDQRIDIVETQITTHLRPVDLSIEASRCLINDIPPEPWMLG